MLYRVLVMRSAERDIAALPPPLKRRVATAIGGLASDPRPPGAKLLRGSDRRWRIRVGDYRVLYLVHDADVLVVVVKVRHRGHAYR